MYCEATGKLIYFSWSAALRACRKYRFKHDDGGMAPYVCKECGRFHNGHPQRRKTKKRKGVEDE